MKRNIILFLIAICLIACTKKDEKITNSNTKGKVQFSPIISIKTKAALASSDAAYVAVTITSSDGSQTVYNLEKSELYGFNSTYLSKPLSLKVGSYKLTEFLILNKDNKAIYATPKDGSSLAYLVADPLSIDFTVTEEEIVTLSPEVISVEEIIPEKLGYVSFNINVVNTIDFLVGVFVYNESTSKLELTTATLKVYNGTQVINSFSVLPKTNKYIANKGLSSYLIKVEKPGYYVYNVTLTEEELINTLDHPLTIVMQSVLISDGLVAFYDFNGNANDQSGNANDGTVNGTQWVLDRNNMASGAINYDGIDDEVVIKNTSVLNQITNISLCAWVKASTFKGTGNNSIIYKGYTSHTSPYYQYKLGLTGDQYLFYTASYQLSLSINNQYQFVSTANNTWIPDQWYFVVGTYDGEYMRIYVNGVESNNKYIPGTINSFSQDIYLATNQYRDPIEPEKNPHTPVAMDDVRIYNRALTSTEIVELYNAK